MTEANIFSLKANEMNKSALKNIEEFKIKVVENLKQSQNDLLEQSNLLINLKDQQNHLKAKKELDSRLNKNLNDIEKNDGKLAFYVSTNIARLGIMILTIFLAQIFISIFRYLTKISKFYDSRADALELMFMSEAFKKANLNASIENISNLLSLDDVDFGKLPHGNLSELNKKANITIAN